MTYEFRKKILDHIVVVSLLFLAVISQTKVPVRLPYINRTIAYEIYCKTAYLKNLSISIYFEKITFEFKKTTS